MSNSQPIPLERAEAFALWFAQYLGLPIAPVGDQPAAAALVGSIRRRCIWVHDVDLLAPMPGPGESDLLFDRIRQLCHIENPEPDQDAGPMLFGPAPSPLPASATQKKIGRVTKGAKPLFRCLHLEVRLEREPQVVLPVEIHRYDPGPNGNRGWIELIRTGPADFGQQVMIRWKKIEGHGHDAKGSDKGYPLALSGQAIPCPTEQDAFRLLKWNFIAPEHRRSVLPHFSASLRERWAKRVAG